MLLEQHIKISLWSDDRIIANRKIKWRSTIKLSYNGGNLLNWCQKRIKASTLAKKDILGFRPWASVGIPRAGLSLTEYFIKSNGIFKGYIFSLSFLLFPVAGIGHCPNSPETEKLASLWKFFKILFGVQSQAWNCLKEFSPGPKLVFWSAHLPPFIEAASWQRPSQGLTPLS